MQCLAHSRLSAKDSNCYLPILLSSGFEPNQFSLMHLRTVVLSPPLETSKREEWDYPWHDVSTGLHSKIPALKMLK